MHANRNGMTFVELLVGFGLLLAAGGALLTGMQVTSRDVEYLSQFQIALNAAQGELEMLSATSFDVLATGAAFASARAGGQCFGLGPDLNCNQNPLLNAPRLAIQIKDPNSGGGVPSANSTLLDLHVAACWRHRGRPIGEDVNCNGRLDAGEDTNGNSWIDSPVMVSIRIGRSD